MSSAALPPIYRGYLSESALADPNNTHAILLKLVGENQDVLEIGPATGYMTRVMVERQNCRVTGFELNPLAAVEAQPFLNKLIIGNFENPDDLAQIGGLFDVILIADVLEHLASPELPLRTMRQYLRPDGRLIVSLPNVAHWSIRRSLLFGRWELKDSGLLDRTHLRWFTQQTAADLISSTGYRVVLHRCSYAFPAHWRLAIGTRLAVWAQKRSMSPAFDGLFAIQHIFVAIPGDISHHIRFAAEVNQ